MSLIKLIELNLQISKKDQDALVFHDDSKLVQLTLNGNKNSFEALVRRYQKLVYNVIFQLVQDHESTQDLTQETFMKAYRALDQYDDKRNFKPWLLKIGSNSALSHLNKNIKPSSLDDVLAENPQLEPQGKENPDQDIESKFALQELQEALLLIPVRQREVFILRYQHDISYEDICEITGLSLSTIKSLLFRARENLRQVMQDKAKN